MIEGRRKRHIKGGDGDGDTHSEEILLHPIPRRLIAQPALRAELICVKSVHVAVGVSSPGVDANDGL